MLYSLLSDSGEPRTIRRKDMAFEKAAKYSFHDANAINFGCNFEAPYVRNLCESFCVSKQYEQHIGSF